MDSKQCAAVQSIQLRLDREAASTQWSNELMGNGAKQETVFELNMKVLHTHENSMTITCTSTVITIIVAKVLVSKVPYILNEF